MISTIITHRNRLSLLYQCLDALLVNKPADAEIVVVDLQSHTRFSQPGVRVMEVLYNGPFWKTKAANYGALGAAGNIVGFLDADIVAPFNYWELASKAVEYDRVCCNVFNEKDGKRAYFAYDDWQSQTGEMPVGNSIMMLKKNDFLAVGGYDERIIGRDYEDQDLIARLNAYFIKKNGRMNNYCDYDAHFIHLKHEYEPDWVDRGRRQPNLDVFENNLKNKVIKVENPDMGKF